MTNDEVHHLAGAYALDALDADEARVFEAHLGDCVSCSTAVAEYERTAVELAEMSQRRPPPSLKARIMADIANTPQVAAIEKEPVIEKESVAPQVDELARRRRPPARVLMLIAAAVFTVVGAAAAFAVLGSTDTTAELIAAPDAVSLELDPTGEAFADATIEIVWSQQLDRALVRATGLPDAGDGMTYELWFVVGDGVAPAGLFDPENGEVDVTLEVDDVAGLGWGVSIEPASGSQQPTGDVIFVGLA